MTDFGNPEERAAATRVAVACKELNAAISHAQSIGVFVKVADISAEHHESNLSIRCMERRVLILPTAAPGISGGEPPPPEDIRGVSKTGW